jgi:hypothetical protein
MTNMASWEQKNGCESNKGFISSEQVVQKIGFVLGYYYYVTKTETGEFSDFRVTRPQSSLPMAK